MKCLQRLRSWYLLRKLHKRADKERGPSGSDSWDPPLLEILLDVFDD